MTMTAVITLCDEKYFSKAVQTIQDIRTLGQYEGDLVLIAIDFQPPEAFINKYNIQVKTYPHLDTSVVVRQLKEKPLTCGDGREINKLTQWCKLYVFDNYFSQWERIIFFDAGFRVLDNIKYYLDVPWEGCITALDDSHPEDKKRFHCQLDLNVRPEKIKELENLLPGVLDMRYFLNCFWIHDTRIITDNTLKEMIELMERFPICRTNEMSIMNIYFAMKKQWRPLDIHLDGGRFLMDWSERDGRNWKSYVGLKYPTTI
jgi:hypothetical protein